MNWWMQVWHVAKKDVQQFRWLFAGQVLVTGVALSAALDPGGHGGEAGFAFRVGRGMEGWYIVLVVLAMVVLDPPFDGATSPWGIFWIRQERSVYLGLTAICLLLVSVGAYYGLVVSRNVATVFAVFGLFFLGHAGLLVFRDHLGAEFFTFKHTLGPILYIAWVVAGTFAFTRIGEERSLEER